MSPSILLASARVGSAMMRMHPLRTLLSALGVTIGVGSLVAVLSIADGVALFGRTQLDETTGVQTVAVRSKTTEMIDGVAAPVAHYPIFGESEETAAREIPTAQSTALTTSGRSLVSVPGRRRAVQISATTASFGDLVPVKLSAGRYFSATEARRNVPVVVVNHRLALELSDDPNVAAFVGREVRVFGRPCVVVGVLAEVPHERTLLAYVPLRAAPLALAPTGAPITPTLLIKAGSVEGTPVLAAAVEDWLAQRYGRWEGRVEVDTQQGRLEQAAQGLLIFKLLMGTITGISLVVGGIGVMNVMLASVAERTREVGIRKAVGARNRDILTQFLAEAVAITSGGSAVGVMLGVAVATAAAWLMRVYAGPPVHAVVTVSTVAIAVTSAVVVGVVFGMYPARRAASISPAEAVQHE